MRNDDEPDNELKPELINKLPRYTVPLHDNL